MEIYFQQIILLNFSRNLSKFGITKCNKNGITKCVRLVDYKVWQNGLQSAVGITKCGRVDYKVRQGL